MKRNLLITLALLAVGLCLFVSCAPETKVQEEVDGVAYVTFNENARGLSASYDIEDYEELYWFYTAKKKDNYGTTGATTTWLPVTTSESDDIPSNNVKGIIAEKGLGGTIGAFSSGDWKFELKAYAEASTTITRDTDGNITAVTYVLSDEKLVYVNDGDILATLYNGQTKQIAAKVKPYGTFGSVQFGYLPSGEFAQYIPAYFKWADTQVTENDANSPTAPCFVIKAVGLGNNDTETAKTYVFTNDDNYAVGTGEEKITIILGDYGDIKLSDTTTVKGYPIAYSKSENNSYTYGYDKVAVDYYSCTVSTYIYKDNEKVKQADDFTFAFRVYGSATTVITGDITEDPQSEAKFDVAKQEFKSFVANTSSSSTTVTSSKSNSSVVFSNDDLNSEADYILIREDLDASTASNSFVVMEKNADGSSTTNNEVPVYGCSSLILNEIKDGKSSKVEKFNNKVQFGIPVASNLASDNLAIYYADDEGKIDYSTDYYKSYDSTNGVVTGEADHFSTFIVAGKKPAPIYNITQDRYYSSLDEAISNIGKTTELRLIKDAEVTNALDVSKLNLDLNGNTLTIKDAGAFNVKGAFSLKNGKIAVDNTSTATSLFSVSDGGSLTLDGIAASGTLTNTSSFVSLTQGDSAVKTVIKNSTLTSGVVSNAVTDKTASVDITIDNSTVTSGSVALDVKAPGTIVVNKSILSGTVSGAAISAGTARIAGSTLNATGTRSDDTYTSAALAVTGSKTTVTLESGVTLNKTGSGDNDYHLYVYQNDSGVVRLEGTIDESWTLNSNMNGAYYPTVEVKIGDYHYKTLAEALSSAKGNDIVLVNNATLGQTTIKSAKNIDLNGKTLTLTGELDIGETADTSAASVVLKSGSIKSTATNIKAGIVLKSNMSLTLDDVDYDAMKRGIYINEYETGCSLTIKNYSNITANVFAVQTNASVKDEKTTHVNSIVIENSTLKAKDSSDQDNTGLLINVPVDNATITGSVISGQRQGAILRGGTYTSIKDTTFESRGTQTIYYRNSPHQSELSNNYEKIDWEDGNGVPLAALVIGNKNGAYKYTTKATLENVTLKVGESSLRKGLHIWQYNEEIDRAVTVTGTLSDNSVATMNTSVNGAAVSITQGTTSFVSGLEKLNNALNTAKTVNLLDDISVGAKSGNYASGSVQINNDVTLEGNGHSITCKTIEGTEPLLQVGSTGDNAETRNITVRNLNIGSTGAVKSNLDSTVRLVNIWNLDTSSSLTLENVKMTVSDDYGTNGTYFRGISTDNIHCTVTMDGCTVSLPHYYAIFIGGNCNDATLEIKNGSVIKGWATIYNFGGTNNGNTTSYMVSNNFTVNATDSSFISVNTLPNGGKPNSFAGVIVCEKGSNNTMTFTRCKLSAEKTHSDSDVTQKIIDIRNDGNNKVILNECELIPTNESAAYFMVTWDSSKTSYSSTTNSIVVDSVDITKNEDSRIEWNPTLTSSI